MRTHVNRKLSVHLEAFLTLRLAAAALRLPGAGRSVTNLLPGLGVEVSTCSIVGKAAGQVNTCVMGCVAELEAVLHYGQDMQCHHIASTLHCSKLHSLLWVRP